MKLEEHRGTYMLEILEIIENENTYTTQVETPL